MGRVVLVTDGVPTAGETAGDKLRERAVALKNAGVERLDAIALGGIRDDALLRSLVNAGLPRGGVVVEGAMAEEDMWRRLNEATRSGIDVKVEGAVFTFPQKVDGVQAGDEVLVYANVPEDKPVRVSVGGAPFTSPDLAKVERPLLERAWVGAKIKSLIERERVEGASAELSKEIVGLSTQFRVMSPKTALLVLESERDYQRFGIDRRALADILVTDGGRVALLKRKMPDPPKPAQVVVAKTPVTSPTTTTKHKGSGATASAPQAPRASAPPAAKPSAGRKKDLEEVGRGACDDDVTRLLGGASGGRRRAGRPGKEATSDAPKPMPRDVSAAEIVRLPGRASGTGPSGGTGGERGPGGASPPDGFAARLRRSLPPSPARRPGATAAARAPSAARSPGTPGEARRGAGPSAPAPRRRPRRRRRG